MKITNIEFNEQEEAALHVKAAIELHSRGYSKEEAQAYIAGLTPQNILRLALGSGFLIRQRGGKRANTGPKGKAAGKK